MGQLRLLIGAEDEPQPKARYIYRSKVYPEPPADWPAPKEACWQCKKQQWPPTWTWAGYEWRCTRKHDA